MTVYNQISENKVKTFLIMFFFILIFSSFFFLLGKYFDSPWGYFFLGFFISLASSVGSYFYGDKLVLLTTGAQPASKKQFFNFYTVTENLTLAAGLPMPNLYVINDHSPNAFATGRDPKHAVVCVTTGLLQIMDRTELEGVIAHELSHVKNFDILLASIVAVLVGTLALISDWVIRSMWWGRGSDNNERSNRNPVILVLFIVSLILTPIIATIIQLAISRRREYLADASAVLLTRYPEGLTRALQKLKENTQPLNRTASSTAHLFIDNPFKKKNSSWFVSLFSTHPPIEERIKILKNM
ncbi:MAG: Protease HtpX-like protein [Candidatus Roizmanbacteria bacterium GW2011_GWC2_34_23]|uniref:Protease HtpX homolog n=1 Tax=Candidatus Roizmanbacteria bacterium GW2011_GWC2_34_23 TaxID=1618484 RepID=A0A0G0AVN8_9BACT|nr:MAG: Protease HtpX-like protein [Candidatus Roizmanbacteria bacterium GW2011_GWC2_34_23]